MCFSIFTCERKKKETRAWMSDLFDKKKKNIGNLLPHKPYLLVKVPPLLLFKGSGRNGSKIESYFVRIENEFSAECSLPERDIL